jgi:2-polyprenyl-3-methyl-5-hydroxy-6-metoxy-1,4-benzoquinol methylase
VLELAPAVYTGGRERPNVALTRHLLANVDLKPPIRCLDVGAEEGLVSVLMERRGAEVVAYDRIYSEERLALVREALGARFELVGEPVRGHVERLWLGRGGPTAGTGLPLARLPAALADRGHPPFDVVIFSGVLYHVYDPLAALAVVRGLARHGGIVLIETAATFDAASSLHLNVGGRFNPLSIWLPSGGSRLDAPPRPL